jgi:hypothetical protein
MKATLLTKHTSPQSTYTFYIIDVSLPGSFTRGNSWAVSCRKVDVLSLRGMQMQPSDLGMYGMLYLIIGEMDPPTLCCICECGPWSKLSYFTIYTIFLTFVGLHKCYVISTIVNLAMYRTFTHTSTYVCAKTLKDAPIDIVIVIT